MARSHRRAQRNLSTLVLLLVVALQIALGAITSADFAGPACPALPGCNGDWASASDITRGFNLVERLDTDQLGAVLTLLYLGWLAIKAFTTGGRLRGTAISLGGLLLLQAGLGIAAVLAELPLLLVTAHNAVGAVLLLTVVNLNHLVTPVREKTAV